VWLGTHNSPLGPFASERTTPSPARHETLTMGRYLADYARSYYAITRRKVCAATPTAWRACVRVPGACACVRVSGVCACVRRSVASTRRTYLLLERLRRALLRLPALRAARAREQAGWDANRHYEILMTGCARARSRTTARTCRAVSAGPCHVSGGRCVPRVGCHVCATCRVAGVRHVSGGRCVPFWTDDLDERPEHTM
jgi:hypothetical protein